MSFDPVHDSITNNTHGDPNVDSTRPPTDQQSRSSDPLIESEDKTTEAEDTKKRKRQSDDGVKEKLHPSVLTNSRTRHLKKADGEPYWRKDIRFVFVMKLFFNNWRIFSNPFKKSGENFDWPEHFKYYKDEFGAEHFNDGTRLTFFELYLITLMKSSKVSKVLKDRLSHDLSYALNFSVISILVNIGRLNTTVNFDHAMKSQFRTYHSVPSLHVGDHTSIFEKFYVLHPVEARLKTEDTKNYFPMSAVKPLQDTPRIKSILKSINDLNQEVPKNFKEFILGMNEDNKFHLNVVSLLFLLCVHEYEIGKLFFPTSQQLPQSETDNMGHAGFATSSGSLFNDIWLKTESDPNDEVERFLWLVYLFLETDFKADKILANPFNNPLAKITIDSGLNVAQEIAHDNLELVEKLRQLVPPMKKYSPEQSQDPSQLINDVDTENEKAFAYYMKNLRLKFLEDAPSDDETKKAKRAKKLKKPSDVDDTDADLTALGLEESDMKKLKQALTTEENGTRSAESNPHSDDLQAEKARKKKRTNIGPIKLNLSHIEAFLSSDVRSGSTSKIMINKRNKNHYMALFLRDLILKRADDLKRKRLKLGHLNCMHKLDSLLIIQSDEKLQTVYKDKIDEFQINYYKDLRRIMSFIEDSADREEPAHDSFLEKAFSDV
ncbi:hypothetical protein KL929_002846 [Ogataea haglerorum]|nr:hypothetical protein KL951_001814 [Ogataea haglerorum]KAG7728849.1 hypothetical protein KL948_003886 [Ogataea haglerorum]KAG7737914.1 hypothetical protein KL923_003461 [Ogataea haglerorum]KAG7747085.1 hypothetical protein KL912_003697 [Ogataea haglerorum]KAG7767723.1 hypothetical protein KL931_003536 [Ogataea haglerorum]